MLLFRKIIGLLGIILCLSSCEKMTPKREILKTSNNLISILKENRESDFDELIGLELQAIGKDDERLHREYIKI